LMFYFRRTFRWQQRTCVG